jgi:hypothetical protein
MIQYLNYHYTGEEAAEKSALCKAKQVRKPTGASAAVGGAISRTAEPLGLNVPVASWLGSPCPVTGLNMIATAKLIASLSFPQDPRLPIMPALEA